MDNTRQQIVTLQTGASDFQAWAVGWYPGKDTIILNCSDIGTYAYHLINNHQLDTVTVSKDIDSIGNIIFQKKYSNR